MASIDPRLQQAFALVRAGNLPAALPIIEERARADDPAALLALGEMAWSGMVRQDPVNARVLFKHAADRGDATGDIYLTNLMASGVAGPRDWPGAMARLRQQARRDEARRRTLKLIEAMDLDENGDPVLVPHGEQLAEAPRIEVFRALMTPAECDYVLRVAAPSYQPSTVFNAQRQLVRDTIRTSDGSTLHWLIEDPALHALNRRLAAVTGSDADRGEAAQVLRYQPGQQYRPHLDCARPVDNPRVRTALLYLNDGYTGGETRFVKFDLMVKGGRGDVLTFTNTRDDLSPDPQSEHAGVPVTDGTKYVLSRWIHERRFQP